MEVLGIERGYAGLIDSQVRPMGPRSVSGIINRGGTILKTARCEEIKTTEGILKAIQTLKAHQIGGLIVIGGDGSFRAANELHQASGIPVICVPATIDNDVAGTDTTIGFDACQAQDYAAIFLVLKSKSSNHNSTALSITTFYYSRAVVCMLCQGFAVVMHSI